MNKSYFYSDIRNAIKSLIGRELMLIFKNSNIIKVIPFPFDPAIYKAEVIFKQVENRPDSLILTFEFQDGDGDLGLDADENYEPYHDVWYFKNTWMIRCYLPTQTGSLLHGTHFLLMNFLIYLCQNYSIYHGLEGYEEDTLSTKPGPLEYYCKVFRKEKWNIF